MLYSKIGGMAAYSGGSVLLRVGDRIDEEHPLAIERPELFTKDDPGARLQAPVIERATRAPGEIRNTPGTGPRGNRVPRQGQ